MNVDQAANLWRQKKGVKYSLQSKMTPWDGTSSAAGMVACVHPSVNVSLGPLRFGGMPVSVLEERGVLFSEYESRPLFFSCLENTYFSVRDQTVFLPDGRAVHETMKFKGPFKEAVEFQKPVEEMAPWARSLIDTEIVNLDEPIIRVGNEAMSNYGHWHLQVLPAIDFVIKSGLIDYGRIALPLLSSWQLESYDKAGFPREKLLQLPAMVYYCRKLLHVSLSDRQLEMNFHPLQFGLYDKYRIAKQDPKRRERVYLTRLDSSRRKMDSELELIEALRTLGFRSYTMALLDYGEQIAVANNASVIVSQRGAALTNLLFSPATTPICELYTFGSMPKLHAYHFRNAARLRDHPYAAYFSPDYTRSPRDKELHWTIDVPDCTRFIKSFIREYETVD